MSIQFEPAWVTALMLLMLRIGVLFFASPMDAFGRLPTKIRVLVVFVLSVFLLSLQDSSVWMNADLERIAADPLLLVLAALCEFFVGLVLVFGLYCVFAAFGIAGRLIDAQSGLGAANLLNPATNTQEALMGTILQLLGLSLFFAMGAHRFLLQGLGLSLEMLPLGKGFNYIDLPSILKQFGLMFSFGVVIAAPVVMILLLLDSGIAFMARTMPQMNVYFLFLPLKVLIGVSVVSMTIVYLGPVYQELFKGVFEFWTALFKAQA